MLATRQSEIPAEDWVLIAQLLEGEQRKLEAEIRHTDARAFRGTLRERLERVTRLLERMPEARQGTGQREG